MDIVTPSGSTVVDGWMFILSFVVDVDSNVDDSCVYITSFVLDASCYLDESCVYITSLVLGVVSSVLDTGSTEVVERTQQIKKNAS